ncbi:MAG TPA: hypothetical protein VGP83_05030 [Pyrinomonadaceae bacterium]|nr:hypothetical protein [Pyrinomonadaceae bacterium]
MKTIAIGMLLVAVLFCNGATRVQTKPTPPTTQFVGTMPCGEVVRAFIGGELCQSVIWRLDLGGNERGETGWSLNAAYGSNSATSVGTMPDGLHLSGKLEKLGDTYRLVSNTGKSISFRQVSSTLIHVLDKQNRLMPGTSAWSYTLSRADVTDDPGRPEQIFGGSYTLSPREAGNTLFGMFGGRTPCTSLVRTLHITLNDGCQRLKWRVTLLQNPSTHEPTRYKIEGSLHHTAREGTWRIVRGTAVDADAVVYQLDGTATEGPMLLWKADDNVLFLLDERKQPLVGTIDFSYTLSRSQ